MGTSPADHNWIPRTETDIQPCTIQTCPGNTSFSRYEVPDLNFTKYFIVGKQNVSSLKMLAVGDLYDIIFSSL